ncbi:MAG: acylphosphatase [Bacteroidota bacterium]
MIEIVTDERMNKHYNIWVKGIVQGVFFRKQTRKKAMELDLAGFVRNLPDGRVYIEAEGNEGNVTLLIEWMKTNPGTSMVEEVKLVEHDKMSNHEIFVIK